MAKFVVLFLALFFLKAEANPAVRIIGGSEAKAGQFPFAAAIYKTTASSTYFCAGALFKNQWIITSGQCVDGAITFTIRLGSNSLSENSENVVRLATDTYILHPNYSAEPLQNDIGLIKLRMPVSFNDYIKPVTSIVSAPIPDYSHVATFGWGQISDSQAGLVDHLRYVFLVTLTNYECNLAYQNTITDEMVCAEGNYNEGTCIGDLGSPLIQFGASSTVYLVGVSSFISTQGCESTDPSGFTRIAPFTGWINSMTT